MYGKHRVTRYKIEPIVARERRDGDDHLLHRVGGSDAHSWAGAERDVAEAFDVAAVLRQKTGWIEAIGIVPQQAMAMQDPRRDDDRRSCNYFSP